MSEIGRWLESSGLGQLASTFADAAIDLDILSEITENDLEKLGIPLGDRKRLMRAIAALGEALPPVEPEALAADREAASAAVSVTRPRAERRQLTVMFTDLVGSTELSARLDPEDMGTAIRAYQDCCAEVVQRWDGCVAKYMGDGVLVYFGYPQAHEDDAERAIRAGLDLTEAVGRLSAAGTPLATRIGVATGLVMVGDLIGEGTALEQTVVGETPNLAARLQALAEPGQVAISGHTRRLVGGLFDVEDLGEQRLKGFAEPVRSWRVIGDSRAESRFEALHGTGMTPLVGREHELKLLLDRWELAKGSEGQVVLVAGEAGIGKSRLIRALRQELSGEPHVALSHFCSPYHTNSALHPIITRLERAAGFAPDDGPKAKLAKLEALLGQVTKQLDEALPLLAALLNIPAGDRYPALNLSPQRQKQRTLEVLIEQLAGLARDRPVLELYEDAHWIDPSTLELVELLVERVRSLPVLAVLTYRPEFSPPWAGFAHVSQLSLNRLGQRQGAAMVAEVAGGKALPDEVLDQIVAKTDGVPLFVEELTKAVLESGLLTDAGDHYVLAGPLAPLALPTTLQDSLMARLDRLAPVKEVAQIGAVIGREFSHDLLAAVSPLADANLDSALHQLVASELIFRRGTPPTATYSFKHALVQDAAYQSLLKSKRQQLHARIAEVLEERFPGRIEAEPELLAHHYTEAGLAQPALGYWLRAGERAARRSAHLEAIAHLRRGLALLDAVSATSDRVSREIALRTALGVSLQATKGFAAPEVGETYVTAEKLCEEAGETTHLYAALQGLWHFHTVRGEIKHARKLAERCYAMARQSTDPALLLAAHHVLCGSVCWVGEFKTARAHLDHALRLEGQVPRQSQTSLISAHLGVFVRAFGCHAVWHLGDAGRAARLSEDGVRLAREGDDPFSLALALNYAAMLRQFGRDHQAAGELAAAAIELCSEHHFAYYLAWATILQGWALTAEGRVDDGIARMRQGLADIEATGAGLRRPYYLALIADALANTGRPEEGLVTLTDAIAVAEATGERWRDADLQRTKGKLLLALSEEQSMEAELCFRRALKIARNQRAKALELQAAMELGRLWCDRGRRHEAYDLVAPIFDDFADGFDEPDLNEARAWLDRLR